jgi:SpoVK/Ycf46/Vps4 family AAA+-type ATPase
MAKTIIERMCSITEKMQAEEKFVQMDLERMPKASADIRALTKLLELSPMQVVILTAIVQGSTRYRIMSSDIAAMLGLNYLKFLTYHQEIECIRKRGYIRIDRDGDIVIPKNVLNCLKENMPIRPEPLTGLDASELLSRIKRALAIRKEDQCTARELDEELTALMELNPDNSVSRTIRRIITGLDHRESVTLYGLVYRYYFENDDMVGWHDLEDYLDEDELASLKAFYRRKRLILQIDKIIEPSGMNGMMNKDYFRITQNVKEELFADVGGVRKEESSVNASRKLKASEITKKTLFYNSLEGQQVKRLKELMSEKSFEEIRRKMKDNGLRTGFNCLFYGSPGTGKTETVYQIARESGRDLFVVDVSQIKSCWVGESEKNIKEVFVKYRQTVSAGGTIPILLFNEADAIFGIRQQGAERAVDKMENSLQNIILQEMEDLDGILMATTNLTANLDKAFERRFLYKVRFDKPSVEARSAIWRSMIPELSEAEAIQLATDFDFSGGQIENVSRKRAIAAILETAEPDYAAIRAYCEEETLTGSDHRRKIGF